MLRARLFVVLGIIGGVCSQQGWASPQMAQARPPPASVLPQTFQGPNGQINAALLNVALARQRAGMKAFDPPPQNPAEAPLQSQSEFRVPGFESVGAGKPLPANTRPMSPAKPFLSKIADMLCGILGGGLRAFGGGIKSVTGAGGTVAMSGILGMMGYAGPYGYDPFGPGQSMDPYAQSAPETNSCYQLLETWLRQCSAQPESFLEISSTTSENVITNTTSSVFSNKEFSIAVAGNGSRVVNSFMNVSNADQQKIVDFDDRLVQMHVISLLEQISQVMNLDVSRYGPQGSPQRPNQAGSIPQNMFPLRGAGRPIAPGQPGDPNSPNTPSDPAAPNKPGMFDQIMSGAGMTPAMGGLVAQTLGPDTYNPWVADGAEPDEFQISGPEKCTRLMNNWLWKCAMSPM